MRQARWGILLVWLPVALSLSPSAQAQERSVWFGDVTLGPAFPDQQGNDFLAGHGFVVQGRLGRRLGSTLSAIVELTHASFGGPEAFLTDRTALAVVPCLDPADPLCGASSGFSFPVRVAIAGAGMEASTGDQTRGRILGGWCRSALACRCAEPSLAHLVKVSS